jgi:molybdate/tungstate transport system substrate-binding protein
VRFARGPDADIRAAPRGLSIAALLILVGCAAPMSPAVTHPAPVCAAISAAATRGESAPLRIALDVGLAEPFSALEAVFRAANPGVDMATVPANSVDIVRRVADGEAVGDLIVVSDHALLVALRDRPATSGPAVGWTLRFAADRLVLARSASAEAAQEITDLNWPDILARRTVRLGLVDPTADPLGYRAVLAIVLAERWYMRQGLFEAIFGEGLSPGVSLVHGDRGVVAHISAGVAPSSGARLVFGDTSADMSPLVSGDVDYAFVYESAARRAGMAYVSLPDAVNLGDVNHAGGYGFASVALDGDPLAAFLPAIPAEVIAYSLTIPDGAPNSAATVCWVAFLLGTEGRRTMAEHGMPLLDPARCDRPGAMPEALRGLCTAE